MRSSEKSELINQLKAGYEEALKQKDRLISVGVGKKTHEKDNQKKFLAVQKQK